MFPWDFNPTIYNPYLSCTPSLPALSYLCFVAFGSSARRYKSQVHAFSLFALFRTKVDPVANKLTLRYKSEVHIFSLVTLSQRYLSLALGSLSVTKVGYTFFLLSPFMHSSSSSFDLVLRPRQSRRPSVESARKCGPLSRTLL